MAVLYFSRAVHLDSQLVSSGHGQLLTHTLPSLLSLPGAFFRSLLVTEHQASAEGTAARVLPPSGRLLRFAS